MRNLGPASTYELKLKGLLAWTLVVMCFFFFFFFLNQAAENPIISNNPITFPSDSAAQIQGWICGLARFTDRLLKREATMSNFLAACALPGFGVRGVTWSLRGGIMTEPEREREREGEGKGGKGRRGRRERSLDSRSQLAGVKSASTACQWRPRH